MIRTITIILLFFTTLLASYKVTIQRELDLTIPQSGNTIIIPSLGKTLTPTKRVRFSVKGDILLRRRFSPKEYILYQGKMHQNAGKKSVNLMRFRRPKNLPLTEALSLKFFDKKSNNPNQDIINIYFDKKHIYVQGFARIFYNHSNRWHILESEFIKQPSQKTKTTGDLAITSNPAGAKIYLNGKSTKLTTPNYLKNIPEGEQLLTLRKRFYQEQKEMITVQSKKITKVKISLKSNLGTITLAGDPKGAVVRLNGKKVGKLPCTLKELLPGKYRLLIQHPFYGTRDTTVTLQKGAKLTPQIALKPRFGTINLPKVPINIPWRVDGEQVASGALRFNPGNHRISWSGGGIFEPVDTLIKVTLGDTTAIHDPFIYMTGSLKIMPIPMQCEVYLDGKRVGDGFCRIDSLRPKKYTVTLKKEGWKSFQKSVTIKANKVVEISHKLAKRRQPQKTRVASTKRKRKMQSTQRGAKTSPYGEIKFASFPPLAKIFYNDSLIGMTSKKPIKIPVGTHKLTFVSDTGQEERTVTVKAGQKSAYLVRFAKK